MGGRTGGGASRRKREQRRRPVLEPLEAREVLAPVAPAPQVTSVARQGSGHQPTRIILTFNQPMDRATVQTTGNYLIIGRNRQGHFDPSRENVRVRAAVYDAGAQSVTLFTRGRLNLHRQYLLVANGNFAGLASAQGIVLDGNGEGASGGNFVTVLKGFGTEG
jgi:hypothetical protein